MAGRRRRVATRPPKYLRAARIISSPSRAIAFGKSSRGRMRSWLAAVGFFAAAALSTSVADADVVTIGHTTFDFDAPAAPLTAAELRFFQAYKDAVNRRDEAAFMALQ